MTRYALLLVFVAALSRPAAAQYFGQNKVQYRHLEFQVLETEHFDVHFYPDEREAAVDAARMAERAYARLSRILNHQYRERQPIILFASHSEFQQNNVTDIGDATGGVTDAFRHRVMLPFTGAYADFDHVLQHELVHQFQYDVFARGRIGAGIQRLIAVQPPLWLFEGMAEYLSTGPVSPLTAMWLRNAALEGHLPTIEEMTYDYSVFPYRYGHALMAYIGERWGDEVIGEILHAVAVSGVERGFRTALGLSLERLSEEWHYAVRRTYLPEIADRKAGHEIGRPVLNTSRTGGRLHLSPALSPDGRHVAYFSEGGSFFVDLYVADAETGQVESRLVRSAFSADFENLRYLNSGGAWSLDGRFFAIAAKSGGRDDLVILEVERRREHGRIDLPLHGVSNPAWAPDGSQLVFTGYDGGRSDLFIVDADGANLRRLTNDRYADLQPAWSPDGRTIAFVTDRGPATDLSTLRFGGMRLALYHLDTGRIELLDGMEGNNIDPEWAPDGRSLAFVSDRTGTANVFLQDLDDGHTYQLTDLFTGVSGLTQLSPAISWAGPADRLLFTYYEGPDFSFSVYAVDNPRTLRGAPYAAPGPVVAAAAPADAPPDSGWALPTPLPTEVARATASVYRTTSGFRSSGAAPALPAPALRPVSVRDLLDSATLALPDSAEFAVRDYSGKLTPDYIAQPSIGYARDNFGRGIFGGTAIALSDMLGNRRMLIAGQVNGRIDEAQVYLAYGNLSRRTNWTIGMQQYPIFFFSGSETGIDSLGQGVSRFILDRFVIRQAFIDAARPFNRFRRLELGLRGVNVGRARQEYLQTYDPISGIGLDDPQLNTTGLGHTNYFQPSIALVFDNSVSLYVGPIMGRRSRLEYAPALGDWMFHQVLADYRRYDELPGPFVLATRTLFFGRFGRDDDQFPIFLGDPSLLRGYTSGSMRRNECGGDLTRAGGCASLEQLIGNRVGVFNAELRFPLFRNVGLGFLPVWFPPIEGAIFFDAGIAWRSGDRLVFQREVGESPALVRQPLTSWGFSARLNLLGIVILRFDYTDPLARSGVGSYWTVSLGPTF